MNALTAVVILVPSILSFITSMAYAYLGYKRLKETPKDEVWETATRIICANSGAQPDPDDFADLYESLKAFKDTGCSLGSNSSLFQAVKAKRDKARAQQSGSSSAPQ